MTNLTEFPNISLIENKACDWLVKLEGDNPPSAAELREFNLWLGQNPKHKAVFLSMLETWGEMDVLSGLSIPLVSSGKTISVSAFLRTLTGLLGGVLAAFFSFFRRLLSTAFRPIIALPVLAMVLTLVVSSGYVIKQGPSDNNLLVTALGEQSVHTLADGSLLWLNSNTQVEVEYNESKRKIILLKGEAHFDVVPEPQRPFEVYAGNRMVKAVGTAFSVYRLEDKIQVMVTDGKVDLAIVDDVLLLSPATVALGSQDENLQSISTETTATIKAVLTSISAGQSVVIATGTDSLVEPVISHERGELARKLSWLEGKLVFAGESLEEVVQEVSRHTPIKIEVTDPELRSLRIGGQFQTGETEALFDVLESGFGVSVIRVNKGYVQLHAKK